MGIGPDTGEDAVYIWSGIEENKVALEDLLMDDTTFMVIGATPPLQN